MAWWPRYEKLISADILFDYLRNTKSLKTVFVGGALIGSTLDRGPGRPVHTDSKR